MMAFEMQELWENFGRITCKIMKLQKVE